MSDETAKKEKPELKVVGTPDDEPMSIPKPEEKFSLEKFKSKLSTSAASVETLQTALPVHSAAEARDFVRLHADEEKYWSAELCFANVPVKGQKRDTLHLIDADIAAAYLPPAKIRRYRLALATKPGDAFFLCIVPTQNLDNTWVSSNLQGCEQAKHKWVQLTSQKEVGVEAYRIDTAPHDDAFPKPKWPTRSLDEIIFTTYNGRMIDNRNHPGLLRLRGERQSIS